MERRRAGPFEDPRTLGADDTERLRTENLVAEIQLLDDAAIALPVLAGQVSQQLRASTHHHQEPSPRGEILGMGLQVLGEELDSLREQRDLDFGASAVGRPLTETLHKRSLAVGM